jgi:hypothetical protein
VSPRLHQREGAGRAGRSCHEVPGGHWGPHSTAPVLLIRPGFAAAWPSSLRLLPPHSLAPPSLARLDQSSGISCCQAAPPAEPPRLARHGPAGARSSACSTVGAWPPGTGRHWEEQGGPAGPGRGHRAGQSVQRASGTICGGRGAHWAKSRTP